jgi:hypothetical protein
MAQNQPNLNQTRQDIKDIAAMAEDTFRSVADSIQSMFRDALEAGSNVSKSLGNDISNNLKALARQSATSLDNQEKLNRGVLKQADIQKQIEARMSKINAIENQINAARIAGMGVGQDILEDLENTKKLNDVYINQLKDQKNILDSIDKEIGQLGNGIKGLGTFFSKLGFDGLAKPLESAINNTKAYKAQLILAEREYQALINKSEELTKSEKERKQLLEDEIKALEKKQGRLRNIAVSLKEELTIRNMTDVLVGKVIQSFFKLDEAQTKFQNLTGGTIPMLDQMNMRLISSVDYIQTAASLTEQTGMNAAAIFTPDTLAAAAEMVKTMGMTQEQANKAAIMSQVNGQTIDQMNDSIKQGTKEHNATNRSALAQGAIMREVYNTSTAIATSLGNSTKRITEAVARAKDLGLSLAEVDGIANSLLNVEQSIASEFEFEVISGKQINLEAARYYALTNQTEKLTAEIGKNQAIVNSFASGNRIEQEAAAKALGLSRDQLAEMYIAQQRKNKLTDAEIAKNMHMEEGDIRRLSVQESINTSINKMTELLAGPLEMLASMMEHTLLMKTIFVAIGGIILTNIAAGLITSLTTLGLITAGQTALNIETGIGAAINTESAGANAASLAATTAQAAALPAVIAEEATLAAILNEAAMASVVAAEAATLGAATPFIIGGLAAVAGAAATYYAMKDGVIDPKKGPIVSGEFGTVQLHPNDQIVAGTNLMPNGGSSTPSSPTIDNNALGKVIGEHVANAFRQTPVQTIFPDQEYGRRYQQTIAGVTTRKI